MYLVPQVVDKVNDLFLFNKEIDINGKIWYNMSILYVSEGLPCILKNLKHKY